MSIPEETIQLLISFLSGDMDIRTFERQIADRLFVLRQKPQVTKEKELLATIQLRLHGIAEGLDEFEVYMAAQSAIDTLSNAKVVVKTDVDNVDNLRTVPYQPDDLKLVKRSLVIVGINEPMPVS